MLKIRFAVRSHIGLVRTGNEDNFYAAGVYRQGEDLSLPYASEDEIEVPGSLFAVCDGMGGEAFGEEASFIAVSALSDLETELMEERLEGWRPAVQQYLQISNEKICKRIREHEGQRMGTTFVSLFLRADRAQISNLGDSRIYRFRNGELQLMSIDHTQAQRLADLGIIDPGEVRRHPERHRLLQHLGIFPSEAELMPNIPDPFELEAGDLYLLCSDGLNDSLGDAALAEALSAVSDGKNLHRVADALVEATLEEGAHDNVTFILMDILHPGQASQFDDIACHSTDRPPSGEEPDAEAGATHRNAEDPSKKTEPAVFTESDEDEESDGADDRRTSEVPEVTLKLPKIRDEDREYAATIPLTKDFLNSVRAKADDTEINLELGTMPQLRPVRLQEEEPAASRNSVGVNLEDTLTPPESSYETLYETLSEESRNKRRVFSQPITTDDLDRFRKAREESLRRHQAYEYSLGHDAGQDFSSSRKELAAPLSEQIPRALLTEDAPQAPLQEIKKPPLRREVFFYLLGVAAGFGLTFLFLTFASML